MNPPHDDFIELRRLLALKRHEQPPPGYFAGFSATVIARIRAGEKASDFSLFDAFSWESSWMQRLWAALERRPIYAGTFGVAVCGLLLAGVLLSESTDPVLVAAPSAPGVTLQPIEQAGVGFPLFQPGASQFAVPRQPGADTLRETLFQRVRDSEKPQAILLNAPGSP